jgi:hypothetical protein
MIISFVSLLLSLCELTDVVDSDTNKVNDPMWRRNDRSKNDMMTTTTSSSHIRVAEHRPWNYDDDQMSEEEEDYDRNDNSNSEDDDDHDEENRVRIVRMKKKHAKHPENEDEDAKIAAHYEKTSHESKKKPRVTLTVEKLTGVDGLIRIPHEFSLALKKKHASFLSSSSSTPPTVAAAASYATQLVDLYADFAHSIWPHTHMLDVFYKIEQLGSKPALKAFLELQRQEITRNPYLEKTLGRETAESLLQSLQEYHKQPTNEGQESPVQPIGNAHSDPIITTTLTTRALDRGSHEEEEEHEATFEEETQAHKEDRLLSRSFERINPVSSMVHAITPHKRSNKAEKGDSEDDDDDEMEATFEEEQTDAEFGTDKPTFQEQHQFREQTLATSPHKRTRKTVAEEESDEDNEPEQSQATHETPTIAQPDSDANAEIRSPRKRSRQAVPIESDDNQAMEAAFDHDDEANVPIRTEATFDLPPKASDKQLDATATVAEKASSLKKHSVNEPDNDDQEMKVTFEVSTVLSGTENEPQPELESADNSTSPTMSTQSCSDSAHGATNETHTNSSTTTG